ncbi:MAG TPA: LuxR C-terminal-related transcriptional regulator [Baekduia sp.]|nr:LuxR C-terminal-related transcriptional regulator [Baekduia sp.]
MLVEDEGFSSDAVQLGRAGSTAPLAAVHDAARRLRGIREALGRLAALDSVPRLISAAPRETCRSAGFDRAMLSHIRGDRLVFAGVSFDGDPVMAADFGRLARAVRPRLDRCAPEHEAVVRQVPILVHDVARTSGVFRPLTHAARTDAYVVAPIVRGGHTVGVLHADVCGAGRALDEIDRELLGTLAAGLGWAMERVELFGDHGGAAAVVAPGLAVAAPPAEGPAPGSRREAATARALRSLTVREHEVLQLLSEGASNAAIGEALVISQATVKSHVRHILRKLGAANRTEAVSLVLTGGSGGVAS